MHLNVVPAMLLHIVREVCKGPRISGEGGPHAGWRSVVDEKGITDVMSDRTSRMRSSANWRPVAQGPTWSREERSFGLDPCRSRFRDSDLNAIVWEMTPGNSSRRMRNATGTEGGCVIETVTIVGNWSSTPSGSPGSPCNTTSGSELSQRKSKEAAVGGAASRDASTSGLLPQPKKSRRAGGTGVCSNFQCGQVHVP